MSEIKPEVGETVNYYDPKIPERIGWTQGFGGRGSGPYAAIVTNDLGVGLELLVLFPGVAPYACKAIPLKPETDDTKPYWDFRNNAQKARATKAAGERAAA